ncbi:MAG: DNA mismatch repair endonuclease MutL [Bdellovibrionaceae bacterium]|nr:DNA mismatch repair endonuclease MutL [Pseudobdellovibrionaceae bacterium]
MSSIQILPPEVVDQIAAGEVVERPAHLVKELVENSIDAGAGVVTIEFSEGGRYVKVTDDGKGIPAEELPKALERFATSKISSSDDLWKLRTFGFRGEALASIAAVSKLNLTSRPKGTERAYQLLSDFGKKTSVDPVGGPDGTTITVQELFANMPARLKFLKSDAAEATQIKTTLKALALAHSGVAFRIYEKNELVFFWPPCATRKERAEQVLEIKSLYEGQAQRENVTAYAIFADPHTVAKTAKNIWLFAQNRWVQDRSMQAAVMEAYRNLLMHGEYPIAAVWVEVDPEYIDVNIHPTKSQVKFHNSSLVFRAVSAAIRESLEQAPWVPKGVAVATPTEFASPVVSRSEQASFSHQDFHVTQYAKKDFPLQMAAKQAEERRDTFQSTVLFPTESAAKEPTDAKSVASVKYWSSLEVLGQANLTYIICQSRDRLVFVDQHAAHERVVFERLMAAWRGGKMEVQEFLFPLAIDLTPDKVEALAVLFSDLEKLGVYLEVLGPTTVGVKAAPAVIKESIMSSVLDKMSAEALELGGSFRMEKVIGDICATMACHSVIRAGQALSVEQMKSLLEEMDDFPLSSFCPHGRPVSVEYPYYKLEKDFGRIV